MNDKDFYADDYFIFWVNILFRAGNEHGFIEYFKVTDMLRSRKGK